MKKQTRQSKRMIRHRRVRARVSGSAERPRLTVFRSLNYVFAQIVDDTTGKTLVSSHSKTDGVTGDAPDRSGKIAVAYRVGMNLAKKALAAGVEAVVFDRSGFAYQGRIRAVADGARDGGLRF